MDPQISHQPELPAAPLETAANVTSIPQEIEPESNPRKKITIAVLAGTLLLLSTSIAAGFFILRQSKQTASLTPTPTPESLIGNRTLQTVEPSATPMTEFIPSPTPKASAKPTAKPTAKPAATSTPLPVNQPDLYVTNSFYISHPGFPNKDSSAGVPTYEEFPYGDQGWISGMIGSNVTGSIDGTKLSYTVTVDNVPVTVADTSHFPAFNTGNSLMTSFDKAPETVGTHTIKMVLNPNHTITESNYSNNSFEATYIIRPDTTAPTFGIQGPYKDSNGTGFTIAGIMDNASSYDQLTILHKIDGGSWIDFKQTPWIYATGPVGESHTYYVKITDLRGNTAEKSQAFTIQ